MFLILNFMSLQLFKWGMSLHVLYFNCKFRGSLMDINNSKFTILQVEVDNES